MNQRATLALVAAYTVTGFLIGLAMGRNVRARTESNTTASYSGGKIIVTVDAEKALQQAALDLIT